MVAWRLPQPVPPSTHPFKYRLVYVVNGERVLGYDNERGKGDHKHVGNVEEARAFSSIDLVVEQFIAEVEAIRRRA